MRRENVRREQREAQRIWVAPAPTGTTEIDLFSSACFRLCLTCFPLSLANLSILLTLFSLRKRSAGGEWVAGCGTKEIKTEQKAELHERSGTVVLTHFYWNCTFPQKSSEGFRNIGCGSSGMWMLFLCYYVEENREKLAEEGRRGRAQARVVDQHGFKSQSCHLGTCLGM